MPRSPQKCDLATVLDGSTRSFTYHCFHCSLDPCRNDKRRRYINQSGTSCLIQSPRTAALVDPLSTSGNLVPRYVLKKAGLDPDKDITGSYVGSHEDVLQNVSSGNYPAGAVASDIYDAYQEELRQKGSRTDEFVILAKSIDIPQGAIAVRKDIQLYDTLRVEDAFLTVGEIDPAILNTIGFAGFVKVTDETYAGLLQIAEYLNINLSTYNG
jgi:phosphonate transport system substrate-binding protein